MVIEVIGDAFIGVSERFGSEQAGPVDLKLVDVCRFGEWFCDVGEEHVDVGVVMGFGEDVDLFVHDVEVAASPLLLLLDALTPPLTLLFLHLPLYIININQRVNQRTCLQKYLINSEVIIELAL